MTGQHDLGYRELLEFLYRAPVGLIQTDTDGAIELINPMSAQLLQPLLQSGGLVNLFDVLDPVIPQLRAMTQANHGEVDAVICDSLRIRIASPRLPRATSVLSLSVLRTAEKHLIAVLFDSTAEVLREQERLARRLADAARIDALTGLPSRSGAEQRLQRAVSRSGRSGSRGLGVLFLNVDRFRQINDAWGVDIGNLFLVQVGQQLRDALVERRRQVVGDHGEGPFAARVSADEFVIVFEDVADSAPLGDFARELLTRLARPRRMQAMELICTFSAGLVMVGANPAGGESSLPDPRQVLQDASIAMMCAKRAGGDRLSVFREEMRVEAAQHAAVEADLRRALAEREIFVVYQPVVALGKTQDAAPAVVGLEALARWQHPTRGLVPPVEFIPLAEACGLIGAIGEFVMTTAFRQFLDLRLRLGADAPQTLAVNLSRSQLLQPGFAADLARHLEHAAMRAQDLQVEVTESLAAQDERVQRSLQEIKALGASASLDDFGTGYSSLSSLHLLPVDTVKIDRSFVSQADTSQHHRVLIRATIQVAESLGMRVIAEGVETESQCAALREAGCGLAQGYLWSAPQTAEQLESWLLALRARGS
jgi:diguanylate cyclase (GGDEF)-like protein